MTFEHGGEPGEPATLNFKLRGTRNPELEHGEPATLNEHGGESATLKHREPATLNFKPSTPYAQMQTLNTSYK